MLRTKLHIVLIWFLLQVTWGKNDQNLDYEIITFNEQNITVSYLNGFSEITFVEHRVFACNLSPYNKSALSAPPVALIFPLRAHLFFGDCLI